MSGSVLKFLKVQIESSKAYKNGKIEPVDELQIQEGIFGAFRLGPSPHRPAEEWRQKNVASHSNRGQRGGTQPQSHCKMVSDVPTGGVTADDNSTKIGHVGEPGIGVVRLSLGLEPPDSRKAVIDGSRKAILRSETVVGGDDESGKFQGEAKAVVLTVGPGARADAEAAAVYVEEDGECRGGNSRLVETEVKMVDGVKEEVFP